ncbi:MAG: phage tail length tape measure family protein [Armatimonadota bacterium]|nr:phage tail length tape measure family protein [Armatimonadota bacterium]
MAASGTLAGAMLAKQQVAAETSGGAIGRLSRSYIDGYGQSERFYKSVAALSAAFDRGETTAQGASTIYAGLVNTFGMVASAQEIAANGNHVLAKSIDLVNEKVALQTAALSQAAIAQLRVAQTGENFSQDLNSRLNIGTPTKSASGSASVFQDEYSKLDTIASLRAEQTGQIFSDELNSRLVGGIRKTARDSASVFQIEFTKIDEIARLKAEQIGQEFQRSLNERMRIGAPVKSARESASAFQAVGEQVNLTGRAFDKFNAISGYGTTQFMALTAAMRHGFDAMAAGMSPMRVIMMELGNFSYGLSGTGGVMGALKALGSTAMGLLSPIVLMFSAITAAVGYSVISLMRFQSVQLDIQRNLTGIGRAAGVSVGDVNKAATVGPGFNLSISEASELGAALAATGKIGVAALEPIIKLAYDFSKTLGIGITEATKELAKAFADPAKGADMLREKLGSMDSKTKELIGSLVIQGDRQQAITILTARMADGIAKAADITGFWTRAWNGLSNSISNGTMIWGRFLDKVFGGTGGDTITKQIEDLTVKLLELQKAQIEQTAMRGLLSPTESRNIKKQIDDTAASIANLTKKQIEEKRVSEETRLNERSFEIQGFINAMVPGVEVTKSATDATIALNQAMNDPALASRVAHVDQLVIAYGRWLAAQKASIGADPVKNQLAGMEDAVRALDQRSREARRQFAIDAEKRAQRLDPKAGNEAERRRKQFLAGETAAGGATGRDADIAKKIQLLGAQATVQDAVTQAQLRINDAEREGIFLSEDQIANIRRLAEEQALGTYAMKQQSDALRIEGATLNMNTGAATAYRLAETQLAEAIRNGNPQYDERTAAGRKNIAMLREQAAATGVVAQAEANRKIAYDIKRGSQTAFLTSEDVQIAEKLKGKYAEVGDALNSLEAAQIRANNAVSGLSQEISSGLSTALLDISTHSKTAGEAFRSFGLMAIQALQKILIQLLFIGPLMRGLQGGGAGGFLSLLFGGAGGAGGATGPNLAGGVWPAASGGVMTPSGMMQLNRYAGGGVAYSPQLAMFGEGRTPEAYVPLPDGRSIPATINWKGPTPTTQPSNMKVTVENHGVDIRVEQLSESDIRIIARDVASKEIVARTPTLISAEVANPNSPVSKSLSRNTQTQRRRN